MSDADASATSERPNVLYVCTDQQFAGALSCAGADWIETPALDRLAAEGVRFPNTYCANPLCTPSRASLLTGRFPTTVGVEENGQEIDPGYREAELGTLFAAAGYDTGYAGKFHVPEIALPPDNDHGFERLCGFDDRAIPGACREFLERDRDRPYFLTAQFDNPHNICEWSRDQPLPWGAVDVPPAEECPTLPANFHPPPYEPVVLRTEMTDDWANGAMTGATPDEWRRYRGAYYRLVEKVDRAVDEILAAVDLDETLVVFTSDHGDGHGAHRTIQKTLFYEESVRVPFVVRPPGGAGDRGGGGDGGGDPASDSDGAAIGDRVEDALVSNGLDLLPTLCDYAGIDPSADLPGRSIRPLVEGAADADRREAVVAQTRREDWDLTGRMVRTERYKYVVYNRGRRREQLFDLRADPGEMVDLTESDRHADVLDRHRELLLEHCLERRDRFEEHYGHPGLPTLPGYEYGELDDRFE
jgi:arylsulfatase A-like enzyme